MSSEWASELKCEWWMEGTTMSVIRGTIQDGKVVFDTPPDWPEGKEVLVIDPAEANKASIDDGDRFRMLLEEEQGTDPESIAKWLAWFDSLEPLKMTQEEEAAMNEWRTKMKAFNVEAVRRQMEEGVQ